MIELPRSFDSPLTLHRVLERRVKIVDDLGEAASRTLVAILIQNVHLDGPLLHRKALHLRGLIAVESVSDIAPIHLAPHAQKINSHIMLLGNELDLALHVLSLSTSHDDDTHDVCCVMCEESAKEGSEGIVTRRKVVAF